MGNTPNIRFKGFTDDWEQRKLSEVAEIVGGGTPSTNIPDMLNQLAQNPYTRHYIGIYVKPGYSVDSVKQEIEKICGQKSFEMQEADENLSLFQFFFIP